MGRMEWAREEFALLEGTRWADEEPGMSFLKLKGARDLNRRELAVLRELVPWRDSVAKQLDRATFRVSRQRAVLDIARTQPARAMHSARSRECRAAFSNSVAESWSRRGARAGGR
jgi:ribonuclease D